MTISTKLLNFSKKLNLFIIRKCSNLVERELEVPPFCDVYINVPYNLKIKPLNIHKYHNCDKLIIQHNKNSGESLECNVDGNHVSIFDKRNDEDLLAHIKIPTKANLYITSTKNITVGQLNGDKINIKTINGSVSVDKFNGESVKITTNNGDITFKDLIQASKIQALVTENGSINTKKLQGLDVKLGTNKGNIDVESSYCTESVFETKSGNLNLNNVHKGCSVFIKEGHLNLVGFDGRLSTLIEKGNANIYLSRILENSSINLKNGSLQLKLADLCQECVKIVVKSALYDIEKQLKCVLKEKTGCVIAPERNEEYVVDVNCSNGTVVVEGATWHDMIKMKLGKNT